MAKKYIMEGGYVISINDGQRHYVSGYRLSTLYGVDARQCYVLDQETLVMPNYFHGMNLDLPVLRPRVNGRYVLISREPDGRMTDYEASAEMSRLSMVTRYSARMRRQGVQKDGTHRFTSMSDREEFVLDIWRSPDGRVRMWQSRPQFRPGNTVDEIMVMREALRPLPISGRGA